MDIATILGMVTGFGLVGYAIMVGAGIMAFVDTQSLLIVVGGTIGATLIHYPLDQFLGAITVAKKAFLVKLPEPAKVIEQMLDFSNRARREGILALEEAIADSKDPFLKKGIQLAVDGENPQSIENILDIEIQYLKDRHKSGASIFMSMAGYAPGLGLVGTLIGLVAMLQNMDDPSTIGPSMAVALLTTFYGALLANLLFTPLSGKLKFRSEEEALVWELTREGVLSISAGDNPRIVEQRLNSFLAPKKRTEEKD
ncbi:MAG: MotA/TolQ/ExbB proton channel family protein [Deltaproteobacteria bacterium]|nr:MotA/TolQ/ExbB proton channel family protein [Deltaproteobacteria bacterium]